ncbi:MAG: hypothetical protein H6Q20_1196 [Bacteroidetes bacterium]|jgi:hypothetical protein|nr:hypothetical protein [Bacteroidota bacterium]
MFPVFEILKPEKIQLKNKIRSLKFFVDHKDKKLIVS